MDAQRLIDLEQSFGGEHTAPRRVRSPQAGAVRGKLMRGGDRMGDHGHGYAEAYAAHLAALPERARQVIIEVGVLRGNGLAMWSCLYPFAELIGIGIDLSNARAHYQGLRARGAFAQRKPELYHLDQFKLSPELMGGILAGRKVTISVDDGAHERQAALRTLEALAPYFADQFVHFIEDIPHFGPALGAAFPQYQVLSYGPLSVVRPR